MILPERKSAHLLLPLSLLIEGFKLSLSAEFRKFVIFPILINFALYITALFVSLSYISNLINQLIPGWLQWLSWILWPLFFICFMITIFFSFTLIANLLAAPFYSRLSAKTSALDPSRSPLTQQPLLIKCLLAELRRWGYLGTLALPLIIISIIPGINVIASPLWLVFAAWSLSIEYTAYPLENQGMLFTEQKKLLKRRQLSALALGGLIMFALSIPLLNLITGPAAVIAATLYINMIQSEA